MTENTYWKALEKFLTAAKEKIPFHCRIGETCFTPISNIVIKIYINYPKNMNCVHKYNKDLVSGIITMGTDTSGGYTVFYD